MNQTIIFRKTKMHFDVYNVFSLSISGGCLIKYENKNHIYGAMLCKTAASTDKNYLISTVADGQNLQLIINLIFWKNKTNYIQCWCLMPYFPLQCMIIYTQSVVKLDSHRLHFARMRGLHKSDNFGLEFKWNILLNLISLSQEIREPTLYLLR